MILLDPIWYLLQSSWWCHCQQCGERPAHWLHGAGFCDDSLLIWKKAWKKWKNRTDSLIVTLLDTFSQFATFPGTWNKNYRRRPSETSPFQSSLNPRRVWKRRTLGCAIVWCWTCKSSTAYIRPSAWKNCRRCWLPPWPWQADRMVLNPIFLGSRRATVTHLIGECAILKSIPRFSKQSVNGNKLTPFFIQKGLTNDVSLEAWKASSGICSNGQDGRHTHT